MRISDWSSDVCSSDLDDGGWYPVAFSHSIKRGLILHPELMACFDAHRFNKTIPICDPAASYACFSRRHQPGGRGVVLRSLKQGLHVCQRNAASLRDFVGVSLNGRYEPAVEIGR